MMISTNAFVDFKSPVKKVYEFLKEQEKNQPKATGTLLGQQNTTTNTKNNLQETAALIKNLKK